MTDLYSGEMAAIAGQYTSEEEYWKNQLAGELKTVSFPHSKDINVVERKIQSLDFQLNEDIAAPLMRLCNNSDIRLHMVLTAALVLLLAKYTGNDDIIVGSPLIKQEMDVDFINTVLILRNRLEATTTFKQMLLQVKQTIVEASKHVNYPLEALLYQLDIPKGNAGAPFPLFDTVILLENIHCESYIRHLNPNILFRFSRNNSRIDCVVDYNASLFPQATMTGIAHHFETLLQGVLENIDAPISGTSLLSEDEIHQLLYTFNHMEDQHTTPPSPLRPALHQLFEAQAEQTPNNIALIFENRQLTYKYLNERANQLAGYLAGKHISRNSVVALKAEVSLEMVIGIIAVMKTGAAYLPIEPDFPEERVEYMIKDSRADALLVSHPGLDESSADHCDVIDLSNSSIYRGDKINLPAPTDSHHPAYIIYTSGSTGKPKGVIVQHNNIVNQLDGLKRMYTFRPTLHHILLAPFTFDPSVQQIFLPMITGGKLFLPTGETHNDVHELTAFISSNQLDVVNTVPSFMDALLTYAGNLGTDPAPTPRINLEYVILAGECFTLDLYKKLKEKFRIDTIINIYGPTEATINATLYQCKAEETNTDIPIGMPLRNYKIRILDQHLDLVPVGVAGEICIAGEGLARGYLNRPELTAEKFIPNPHVPGEHMYLTGDLGFWLPDGNIKFAGRKDFQIKIRGMRVELSEIRQVLLDRDRVQKAAVIDREDQNGEKYICAYIVLKEPHNVESKPQEMESECATGKGTCDTTEIRQALTQTLPDYMIPAAIIPMDDIPLTQNGKLDRKRLPKPDFADGKTYVAPRNFTEKKLTALWADTLQTLPEKIGIDADFFEKGGHSLRATILTSKIHKEFNVKVPLADIYTQPTIRELAQYIESSSTSTYSAITSAGERDHYPLSFPQKRLYVIQLMDEDTTAYNIPQIVVMKGNIDVSRIQETFRKLILRHESFRTSFQLHDNEPIQKILPDVPFTVQYREFTDTSDEMDEAVRNFVSPFQLESPPLLRVGVFKIDEAEHLLLVDMHHIISDGVSHQVLVADFLNLYRGIELPNLPLQYKDFAQWQNGPEAADLLKQQETFWLKEFEGDVPVLDLPIDFSRPTFQSTEGAHDIFLVDIETTGLINAYALEQGSSLFMVLLSIYYIMLSRLSGSEDIVVGTPIAGRSTPELNGIIGMFVNTLALRNFPSPDLTFNQFHESVKARVLEAFEYQDYPFEDLVREVVANRDASRNPLFDVMFGLQNIDNQNNKEEAGIPGLTLEPYEYDNPVSTFDMAWMAEEESDHISVSIEYCSKLFHKETIHRFAGYFKQITAAVLKNPGQLTVDIDMLPERLRAYW
ncbi:MAG: amino acid adenylation domain-containing protein, partial [bacterium]|nr:amino acid adenylation domain-containing protein [bacterium]